MASSQTTQAPAPRPCRVLTLDGGGVRGLSSLLILQSLMGYVNSELRKLGRTHDTISDLRPHDVFDLVVGTSTGGLIAILLGKLGLTPEECIRTYNDLSKRIFGKKHLRGRFSRGLAYPKYSGRRLEQCVCDLLKDRGYSETTPMMFNNDVDKMACAVVCREYENESKYSDVKDGPVPICSRVCPDCVVCTVAQAARATSAAPTFFPIQKISNRFFVDGGLQYNNPSMAVLQHYGARERIQIARGIQVDCHGPLDFSNVSIINLGTGTKRKDQPTPASDRFASFKPSIINMGGWIKRTLTAISVESENTAQNMSLMAEWAPDRIKYERFSADTGVFSVKMDKYKKLGDITRMTREYLASEPVRARLEGVARGIANDYQQRSQPPMIVDASHPSDDTNLLTVQKSAGTPSRQSSELLSSITDSFRSGNHSHPSSNGEGPSTSTQSGS